MKLTLTLALFSLFVSATAFSHETCSYRFNENLAVTLTVNDRLGENESGSLQWDDINTCVQEDGNYLCTEIGVGTHKVRFGAVEAEELDLFRIRSITKRDDLRNVYDRRSELGNFIRGAIFVTNEDEQPEVTIRWRGNDYDMICTSSSDKHGEVSPQ